MGSPAVLFVGRWQPCHLGHEALIREGMRLHDAPAVVYVRDIEPDARNPFTTSQTVRLLREAFRNDPVTVIVGPDIRAICYGRGVGYVVEEIDMPKKLTVISASNVRSAIEAGDDTWREFVSPGVARGLDGMSW